MVARERELLMKIKPYQVIISTYFVGTILFGRPLHTGLAVGSYNDHLPAGSQPIVVDVPYSYWAWEWIETLYRNGVTAGCSTNPPMYCPEDLVTRAQMAVFLERGVHGSDYQPPAVGGGTGFNDVVVNHWAAAWIKQLAADGITTGCGGGNYCPEDPVTRVQMAIFLLRAKYGAVYTPPAVEGSTDFNDVPTNYWAAAWIKQLALEGITSGCGNGNYCPDDPVTRAQMAVFLVRTFNLADPLGTIIVHEPDDEISYRWYSYVPRGLDKNTLTYILITGLHGQMAIYEDVSNTSRIMLQERLLWPGIEQFILLVPVIPRYEKPAYPVAFDLGSFRIDDDFYRRADLKVNLMIDQLIADLSSDGYLISNKVMIEGFSAGGMFAQRYALLQPGRVKAIAGGQCGGHFILPEASYQNTTLNWPVGINNLFPLSKIEFDRESYKQISQFIFIGDEDTGEYTTTVWIRLHPEFGTGDMWEAVWQMEFLNITFGETDPIRLQNEIAYLNGIGYEKIEFKLYPGLGHEFTNLMIKDVMNFLIDHTKD